MICANFIYLRTVSNCDGAFNTLVPLVIYILFNYSINRSERMLNSIYFTDEDILSVGKININPLSDLILVTQSKELLDSLSKNQTTSSNEKLLQIGSKSKIFELDDCKGCGKV